MKKQNAPGLSAEGKTVLLLLLFFLFVPLVPSSGPVNETSDMIADQTDPLGAVTAGDSEEDWDGEESSWTEVSEDESLEGLRWDEEGGAFSESQEALSPAGETIESGSTPQSASDATVFQQHTTVPELTPEPTPESTPYIPIELSMSDFSGGNALMKGNYDPSTKTYQDESITVVGSREMHNGTIYYVADVTIAHPSQLRTALGGTASSAARSSISSMCKRVNAVVGVNGDFYPNRTGGFIVRQGKVLNKSNSNSLDLLVVDYEGNFHCISAKDKKSEIKALKGQIYQCFCFGPVLIRDGVRVDLPNDYSFGIDYLNPRAGIGQLGPLHYLLVVASGRNNDSKSITVSTLAKFMEYKGCVHAFNLDGGASSVMYFRKGIVSKLTNGGERSLYDIIYFASTAGMTGEAKADE